MRLCRLILSIFTTIVGVSPFVYSIDAQSDDLTPIYTNTAPEQFAWSTDSTNFVFLGSTTQRGVQIPEPNWYSYDVATAILNNASTWSLQPVLTSTEIANLNPFLAGNTTFMFVSPNGRYVVYTIQDTQALALGDRLLGQVYPIPNVFIPSPTIGTDQFRVLWSADSTAFIAIYASAHSDEFGILHVRGFADNPVKIEMLPIGATLIDGRAFRYLNAHDISADGSHVLLSGIEVFPNTDLPPSPLKLILWNPSSPEDGEIFDMFTGQITGASFEADENSLLIVNEQGLVRFDRTTNEIAILNSGIDSEWVSQALFSPDGEFVALIHEDVNTGNKTIYIAHIADIVIPTQTSEPSDTPTFTPPPR